jgi:uncharacterized protein
MRRSIGRLTFAERRSNPMPFSLRLIPRQERFFEMLRRSADNVSAGTRLLMELMEDRLEPQRKARKLKDIEHVGDEITHEIFAALDRSFVTPLDRDDIARLATALDDVLDWTEDAARRMHAFDLLQPTALAQGFARVLNDQAQCICRAIPLLADPRHFRSIRPEVLEIHRLENEADDLMSEALRSLYVGITDIPGVVHALKWADVYEVLEEATDKAEHVGTALESILIKNG